MSLYKSVKGYIPWDWRFRANHLLLDSPRLGSRYMTVRRQAFSSARVGGASDLFIDGFPRSANTFAYLMLKDLYEPDIKVVGHGHSASATLEAVKFGAPAVLLVRDPRECVPSLVQLADGVRLKTAFKAYERFHRVLLPVTGSLFIGKFETVTADPAGFVAAIQARFDLPPRDFIFDADTRGHVDQLVVNNNKERHGGRLSEQGLARPSNVRKSATQVLESSSENFSQEMARAVRTYQEIVGGTSF